MGNRWTTKCLRRSSATVAFPFCTKARTGPKLLGRTRKIQDTKITAITTITVMSVDNQWVGCDLDGTLAYAEDFHGEEVIGEPIPAMVERLKDHLRANELVKIFTARASSPAAIQEIKAWLQKAGLPDLEVTNVKDHLMKLCYDDKAVQVVKNTGRLAAPEQMPESHWAAFERLSGRP